MQERAADLDKLVPEFAGKVTFVALNVNQKPDDGKAFNAKLKLKNMTLVYMPEDKSAVSASYGSERSDDVHRGSAGRGPARARRLREEDADGELKKMRDALTKLIAK